MLENIASVNLTELIEKKSTPSQLRVIQEVAKTVNEGMSIQDSLALSRITQAIWDKWNEDIPEIAQFIHIQRLEYKQKLMRVLNTQATQNQDFKLALQLLVAAFPAEFNPAIQKENEKKKPANPDDNSMQQIFQTIQSSYESPIKPTENNVNSDPTNLLPGDEPSRFAKALSQILS
jgi:hypothetical protein